MHWVNSIICYLAGGQWKHLTSPSTTRNFLVSKERSLNMGIKQTSSLKYFWKVPLKTSVTKNFKCCWWIMTIWFSAVPILLQCMTIWFSAVPILLQCLVVYETEDLKTKTLRFNKKKMPISKVSEFWFCPIPKIGNSETSESFILLKFLAVHETQKNGLESKKLYNVVWEEKMPISEVSEFSILHYTWNWKIGNLAKFSFTSNYYCFGCKIKTFNSISIQLTSCHMSHVK